MELLLAAVLASLLLTALYLAMSVTIRQTQVARDAAEVEHLSRGIFNKITLDLSGTLAPLPPKSGGNAVAPAAPAAPTADAATPAAGATPTPSATPATGSGGSAAPATGSGAAATGSATGTGSTDASASGTTDTATASAADVSSQGGMVGTEKQLTVYTGRTPEAFTRFGNPGEQVRADQRQVIYWVGPSGGLYRQERPWVTADGVRNSTDPDPGSADAVLLADEVTDVSFEYSDGSAWATEWDGSAPGPDGVTPLGPPRAIRVTLTLKVPLSQNESVEKQISHVIAVRAAPGTYTVPLVEAPTDGATGAPADSSGGSGSGTTGAAGGTGGATPSTGAAGGTGGAAGGSTGGAGGARPSTGGAAAGGTGGAGGGSTGGRTGGSGSGAAPGAGTGGGTGGSGSMGGSSGGTAGGGGAGAGSGTGGAGGRGGSTGGSGGGTGGAGGTGSGGRGGSTGGGR